MEDKKENLKAIFLLGTLKKSPTFSHTETLCELLIEHLNKHQTKSDIIRLADYTIHPGIETYATKKDDWPKLLKKVLESDIIIFATPIWWGIQSSLTQRVIERMDALNDKLLETGESDFANKVGGIVITGAEDGSQHIIGNITNFMSWNGMSIPPACSLSYLGSRSDDTKEKLMKKFKRENTNEMAKRMAINLVHLAKLLKGNSYPIN